MSSFRRAPDLEDLVQDRAARSLAGTRIGYRRGSVHVTLTGGWSLTIPGEFAEDWEEGGETWIAWQGGRRIRFTSWSIQEDEEPQPARAILADLDLPDGQVFEHRDGPVHGRAVYRAHDEPDETGWNLHAFVAVDGSFARVTSPLIGRTICRGRWKRGNRCAVRSAAGGLTSAVI